MLSFQPINSGEALCHVHLHFRGVGTGKQGSHMVCKNFISAENKSNRYKSWHSIKLFFGEEDNRF